MPRDVIAADSAEQRLCAHLIRSGLVECDHLERAKRLLPTSDDRLPSLLTKLGLITETDLAQAMADALELATAEAPDFPDSPVLIEAISKRFLKDARIVPLAVMDDSVVVAMVDPTDDFTLRALRTLVDRPVVARVARPVELDSAIARLYGSEQAADGLSALPEADDGATSEDVSRLKDMASEAPVIRLVNQLIAKAVETRATDIHIEPFEKKLCVRFRIDGLLRDSDSPPLTLGPAVASRIKIMAKLNIAERRLPQDGRIRTVVRGREIDLRISVVPTAHGESIVMRVLDRNALALDFRALGYDTDFVGRWVGVLERPHGIVLVTGPTGSGKTTTLYASLAHLNTPVRKIITVEDPIEYQLDGVNQIQVKPQIGLSFAAILRSILRQDPDVMMVGEIRDLETAEIAIQASLTGHVVLSTLHTNDAPSTLLRLLDMGIPDYLLASTINGILAQRLVRTLCDACAVAEPPARDVQETIGRALGGAVDFSRCRAPRGCPACGQTGFRGRTAISELLPMGNAVRRAVSAARDADALRRIAAEQGMRTLLQDGLSRVVTGVTTFDEVARVTYDAAT